MGSVPHTHENGGGEMMVTWMWIARGYDPWSLHTREGGEEGHHPPPRTHPMPPEIETLGGKVRTLQLYSHVLGVREVRVCRRFKADKLGRE